MVCHVICLRHRRRLQLLVLRRSSLLRGLVGLSDRVGSGKYDLVYASFVFYGASLLEHREEARLNLLVNFLVTCLADDRVAVRLVQLLFDFSRVQAGYERCSSAQGDTLFK